MSESNENPGKQWEYAEKSEQEEQLLKEQLGAKSDIEIEFDEEEAAPFVSLDKTALIKEILKLKKDTQQNWDQFVRAKAETNNLLQSAEKEKQNIRNYALKSFVQSLISVIDNFERSMDGIMADSANINAIRDGIQLTHKDFLATLEKFGVEMLNPVGERFNPEFHEAISMQPKADTPANVVLQVLQKGCVLNGRLVRPAMVIVSSA